MSISKEELAKLLNNSEIRLFDKKLNFEIKGQIKDTDLVIVYGESDDLMEFRGAIHDEVGVYDGDFAYLTNAGLTNNKCEDDHCPYFLEENDKAKIIQAFFCKDDYTWLYETDIPHATFNVLEDDSKYCRGIVFNLGDV